MRLNVPPRMVAAIAGGVNNWVTDIWWTNDGIWHADPDHKATYVSGSVTADATAQIRWNTSDLVVKDAPWGPGGLVPWQTRFRVFHGIEYRPGDRDMIGMGVYRLTNGHRDKNNGGLITLTGWSFEHYLVAPWGSFGITRQFQQTSAQALVEKLIREVLPKASISWADGVDGGTMVPELTTDGDRWSIIDGQTGDQSVARAISGRVFCNGDGVWVVAPRSTLQQPAVWASKTGEAQLSAGEDLSLEGLYNVVKVSSETVDGSPQIGPFTVADVDPHSPTNILVSPDDGGIGQSVYSYTSDQITSDVQAIQVGQSILASSRGLQQQLSFSTLHNPLLEPDDVITVETDDGPQKTIFDTITYDLTGAPMTNNQVRTTSTRFTGQVAELFDPDLAGGE